MSNKIKLLLTDGSWWISTTDALTEVSANVNWAFVECTDLDELNTTYVNVDKIVRFFYV